MLCTALHAALHELEVASQGSTMLPKTSQLFCMTSTVTWLLRMQYCVVDPTMNLTSRPLLCAAIMMATARSSSAFMQIICPTLSASSAPRRMLTWYGICTSTCPACSVLTQAVSDHGPGVHCTHTWHCRPTPLSTAPCKMLTSTESAPNMCLHAHPWPDEGL